MIVTKKLLEEILTSKENLNRTEEEKKETQQLNDICSNSDLFVQLCLEIMTISINEQINPVNAIGCGIIAGIEIGIKLKEKELKCQTTIN